MNEYWNQQRLMTYQSMQKTLRVQNRDPKSTAQTIKQNNSTLQSIAQTSRCYYSITASFNYITPNNKNSIISWTHDIKLISLTPWDCDVYPRHPFRRLLSPFRVYRDLESLIDGAMLHSCGGRWVSVNELLDGLRGSWLRCELRVVNCELWKQMSC